MNGTCTHHEHINASINRIDATCVRERTMLWGEINCMKKWIITGLAAMVLNLLGVVTTLVMLVAKG